jgi:hypothetical protein
MELLQSADAARTRLILPCPRLIHYHMPIFILDHHEFQIIAFCTNGNLQNFIHDNAASVWNMQMHCIQHQTTSQNGKHHTTELTVSTGLLPGKKNATTPSNNHTVSFVENERILQWLLEILGSLVDL